jgi:hypothetical protein
MKRLIGLILVSVSIALMPMLIEACGGCDLRAVCPQWSDVLLSTHIPEICHIVPMHNGATYHWQNGDGTCTCQLDSSQFVGDFLRMCTFDDGHSPPGQPDAGTNNNPPPSADAGMPSCATPNHFECGTDNAGNETACGSGLVCCYVLGPGSSMTCGATSSCVGPGSSGGASDQCPQGQYQLCKFSSECGQGYTCNSPTSAYCVPM